MRKLEKEMVMAINEGRNWTGANTRVICNEKGALLCCTIRLFLHV